MKESKRNNHDERTNFIIASSDLFDSLSECRWGSWDQSRELWCIDERKKFVYQICKGKKRMLLLYRSIILLKIGSVSSRDMQWVSDGQNMDIFSHTKSFFRNIIIMFPILWMPSWLLGKSFLTFVWNLIMYHLLLMYVRINSPNIQNHTLLLCCRIKKVRPL